MLQRVVDHGGYYEWYKLDGTPVGSGTYRGTAGVLFTASEALRAAAAEALNHSDLTPETLIFVPGVSLS